MCKRNHSNGLRLGGEFYHPGEVPAGPVVNGQVLYLRAVARLDEAFSAELLSKVAPCWARIDADDPSSDGVPQLYTAARSVLETFSLPDEWAEACALAAWSEMEDRPELPAIPDAVLLARLSDPELFRPELFFFRSGWPLVEVETRKQAAVRIRAEFEKELSAYLDSVESEATAFGLARTPAKRARGGPPEQHFDWLARFEVQGWSHAQIAKYYKVAENTVKTAVPATAAQIGLIRRTLAGDAE